MIHDFINALVLGIVEGITEFLPVSSTGHLILVNQWFHFSDPGFSKMFDVVIQVGAILAVAVFFRKDLLPIYKIHTKETKSSILSLWLKVIVAVIPALGIGFLTKDLIKDYLFNSYVVAGALAIWGLIIILIESRKVEKNQIQDPLHFSWLMVLGIGLFQCLALVPGTSRSAATIIGALLLGASRPAAARFSFFLAIPTLGAAAAYSLFDYLKNTGFKMSMEQLGILGVGTAVSFIVAWVVIAGLMKFISHNNFKIFGWYRIALAAAVLAYFLITGAQPTAS